MTKYGLLVIDMQQGFLSPRSPFCIQGAAATVPACAQMIHWARERKIPVFFITRLYRADGSDVERARRETWLAGGKPLSPGCVPEISTAMPEEFEKTASDYHLIKQRYSAFFQTELDLLLRRLGIDTVILTGTTTPNCIRTTCYDALSLEYDCIVVSDCTSSASDEIQASNLRDMANVGAVICTAAELRQKLGSNEKHEEE